MRQADYRVVMAEYEKDHPKPPRRQKRARDPTELKRPQSAYFFFLADFREIYKVCSCSAIFVIAQMHSRVAYHVINPIHIMSPVTMHLALQP